MATADATYIPGLDFKLDTATGDLVVSDDFAMVDELEAIRQACELELSLIQGEYILDIDYGIDYFGDILGQKTNDAKLNTIYSEALYRVTGVNSILKLDISRNTLTRAVTINWEVDTDFGALVAETTTEV